MKHLKDVGFINKNGVILKDPDSIRQKFNSKSLIRDLIKRSILKENNFFLRNHRSPYTQTINSTINGIRNRIIFTREENICYMQKSGLVTY